MPSEPQTRSIMLYKTDGETNPFLSMPDVGLRVFITLEGRTWAAYVQQADDLPKYETVRHENHDACVFLACAAWAGAQVDQVPDTYREPEVERPTDGV